MRNRDGAIGIRNFSVVLACSGALFAAGCVSSQPKAAGDSTTKEYFSEAAYGVKASPRVTAAGEMVPQRVGRYQVGNAYKVKGRWYKPQLDTDYKKVGSASWYGRAFNGRLTANGEVYDMARLTAAHPTMPLPSYARVTNLENGSSVIVRVNDRGPFEENRIIDLSKRAAQLLDCHDSGLAKVEVAYVGPAPLQGNDDHYLLASYQPGGGGMPDPSQGLPTGVMVAMNGTTPTSGAANRATVAFASQENLNATMVLPTSGPLLPDRPEMPVAAAGKNSLPVLSYADQRINAASAFDSLIASPMSADEIRTSWRKTSSIVRETGYLAIGTWDNRVAALREMKELAALGRPLMEASNQDGQTHYSVSLYPDGRYALDSMLEKAWSAGARDAFAVRD